MKIAFVSNFINHHQTPLCDELYRLNGGNFWFIETQKMPNSFRLAGYPTSKRKYVIKAWENGNEQKRALDLCAKVDVLIAGGGKFIIPYEKERLLNNKLTFEYAERSLKRGWINLFSPTNIKMQLYYHALFYKGPFYKLCASAYTAKDMYLQHSFKGKCFKFGYFPQIPSEDIEKLLDMKFKGNRIRIIWCARFITWKHPEIAVLLAERLFNKGYDFEINMIGGGPLYDNIKGLIDEKGLADFVHLLGNHPNKEVLEMMARHHIFLFTSDKNEGWGVVLNEAMGRACCPVASHLIGAVPFLLEHKSNGLVYESGNLDSLTENIEFLINHPDEMKRMASKAYFTMKDTWNPYEVAKRLIRFFEEFLSGNVAFTFKDGPLSVATPISEKYSELI